MGRIVCHYGISALLDNGEFMSALKILRNSQRDRYVTADISLLEDSRLSWKAKGLLLYFISRPDGWEIHNSDIAKRSTEGIRSIRAAKKELEDNGYLVRKHKGHGEWEYIVSEKPFTDENPGGYTNCIDTKRIDTKRHNIEVNINTNKHINIYVDFVNLYHELCPSMPKVKGLSAPRSKHIKARIDQFGMERIRIIFKKIEASDFLTRRIAYDSTWRFSFDWMIGNETNMLKVEEEKYDNTDKGEKLDDIEEKWRLEKERTARMLGL